MVGRLPVTTESRGMGPMPAVVIDAVGRRPWRRLLRRLDLPEAIADRPDVRLPLTDMAELFAEAAQTVGDPCFGLHVGSHMRVEDYGAWVQPVVGAATLGGALERATRLMSLFQARGGLTLDVQGDTATFSYHPLGVDPARGRQHADHTLPPLLAFFRRFLGTDWRPAMVEVPYSRNGARTLLADELQIPVRLDAGHVGVVFHRSCLRAGTVRPSAFATDDSPVNAGAGRRDTLRAMIEDIVALHLLDGQVDFERVVARLSIKSRTLQRALAAEGLSYRGILDTERRRLACRLLDETSSRIAEVASALGYQEQAHFTRAFRRWTGCSPTQYRKRWVAG